MKPSITRWKTSPSKYGRFVFCPVFGSVNSLVPSARPTKFATVFGTSSSNSLTVKFPSLVVKCACNIGMLSPSVRRSYRYLHLDVFTATLFGGNQLAVFLDGRGLDAGTMQAIAKEMNFSESTFVLPPERPDTDMRVRIFTPGEELPMAGHPTIGTAFALACTGVVSADRPRVLFGLGVGPTDVELIWEGDDLRFAWMTQLRPEFGAQLGAVEDVAAALGLPADAVAGT